MDVNPGMQSSKLSDLFCSFQAAITFFKKIASKKLHRAQLFLLFLRKSEQFFAYNVFGSQNILFAPFIVVDKLLLKKFYKRIMLQNSINQF